MKALEEDYSDHRQRNLLAQKSRLDRYLLDSDNSRNLDSTDLGRSLEETSLRGFAAD